MTSPRTIEECVGFLTRWVDKGSSRCLYLRYEDVETTVSAQLEPGRYLNAEAPTALEALQKLCAELEK